MSSDIALRGNMRLLPVLFILTSVEAKRRRLENHQADVRRSNTNDVDVYPNSFSQGQDFGHVYRDGFRGDVTDVKTDIIPKTIEEARQLLRQAGNDFVMKKRKEDPIGFSNPRDKIWYTKESSAVNVAVTERGRRPQYIKNITQSIRKQFEEEIQKKIPRTRVKPQHQYDGSSFGIVPKDTGESKVNYFSKNSFQLASDAEDYVGNWTTCEEFAKRAVFHPDDVINIQWVPFYIWSPIRYLTSVVHKLTYPTKKLVKRYKEEFGPYLNMQVDWEQPKLLLKEDKDILLIAGDRKGLFYGIPYFELPTPRKDLSIKLTVIIIRLKIVDPYLAMTYCNDKYATIMSVDGTGPETDEEKAEEAKILKFQGLGNPTSRDLELEAHKSKHEAERKRREEASKYINVERPDDRLDPSLW